MTRHEIALIAVKLVGIGLIAKALATASTALGQFFSQRTYDDYFYSNFFATSGVVTIMGAAWLVAGFYCWHSADRLARQMVDDDVTPVTSVDLRGEDLLSLGSAVIGLFLLLPAIHSLLTAALAFGTGEESLDQWWSTAYWQQAVYAALFELAFGVWLVLGSRGIAAFIAYWRSAGTPTSTRAEVMEPKPSPVESPTPEEGTG
jgi:hypothetical protein